jgi:hypothetical protein
MVKVRRFLVSLEEAGGDEVAAYDKFGGGSGNAGRAGAIEANTVGKKRKLTMDPTPAVKVDQAESEIVGLNPPPSTVVPPIAHTESSSVLPTSKAKTEAGVSSRGGRVGKKCKMAHTAIPEQQALEVTPSAGVSSRGRQCRMSQVMAESVS